MTKKIDKNNVIFQSKEFQDDKYKFYIALKILSNDCSVIYSNENDYVIMQMNDNLPIWIWTKDNIENNLVDEVMETIELYFNKKSKITCKKEFYDLLLEKSISIIQEKVFEMGTLHCEKTLEPKNIKGTMALANISDLDTLAKYWYNDILETENDNYTLEQAKIDIESMISEGNFYILKDQKDKIVCMARYTLINDIASINKVYTPIEERKKGYCANLIYDLSNMLLNQNITPMLYTDYNYIPSNKSYMNVGYTKDGILVSFYLNKED